MKKLNLFWILCGFFVASHAMAQENSGLSFPYNKDRCGGETWMGEGEGKSTSVICIDSQAGQAADVAYIEESTKTITENGCQYVFSHQSREIWDDEVYGPRDGAEQEGPSCRVIRFYRLKTRQTSSCGTGNSYVSKGREAEDQGRQVFPAKVIERIEACD